MLRVYFVRHGQTDWNVQGRVQGGGALDAVGAAQAIAVGARLAREHITAVYGSPAARAQQTARAIARPHHLPVRRTRLLRDLDYGDYAGALLRDAQRTDPGLWEHWRRAPNEVRFPHGDSLADLRRRVLAFVARLRREHRNGTVVAATHDSPVRTLACIVRGLDDAHHNDAALKTSLASLTLLVVDGGRWTLATHNDVSHLVPA